MHHVNRIGWDIFHGQHYQKVEMGKTLDDEFNQTTDILVIGMDFWKMNKKNRTLPVSCQVMYKLQVWRERSPVSLWKICGSSNSYFSPCVIHELRIAFDMDKYFRYIPCHAIMHIATLGPEKVEVHAKFHPFTGPVQVSSLLAEQSKLSGTSATVATDTFKTLNLAPTEDEMMLLYLFWNSLLSNCLTEPTSVTLQWMLSSKTSAQWREEQWMPFNTPTPFPSCSQRTYKACRVPSNYLDSHNHFAPQLSSP